MSSRKNYKKLPSGGAGAHGVDFQINILTLFLLEAYESGDEFWLSTENDCGGRFDDVVLETTEMTILLQAKHKEDPTDKKNLITYNDIFPSGKNRDDFNLHKYIKYFPAIKKSFDNIDSLILCTNTNLSDKQDEINNYICCKKLKNTDIFSFCNEQSCYIFNQGCKNLLLQENSNLNEEDVSLFLEKLQLIFVEDEDINKRIENLIETNDLFDATTDVKMSTTFLKENIKTWFKNKKGVYLTRLHVEALRSQYFIEQLEKINIFFSISPYEEETQYSCYVIKHKQNINIHLLKIYQNLQETKVLIINPDDKTHLKIQIIISFNIEDFVYLLIPIFKNDYEELRRTVKNIVKQTSKKIYKKIVFITDNNEIILQLKKDLSIEIKNVDQIIRFKDFSVKTQEVLCSKNVVFQGKNVPLKEVVCPHVNNMNNFLEEQIIIQLINQKENIVLNEHYEENVPEFYVQRLINEKNSESVNVTLSETDLCDTIVKDNENKMVLILDGPGMGKTTILSRLQQLINNKHNFWIIRINLSECFKIFKDCLENNVNVSLEELIESKKEIRLNNLEKKIMNLPKNVIVLLDAFDEISPMYNQLIINLIKSCENKENIRKIVITSRPHCQNDLTNSMEHFQCSLNQFSNEDQSTFLTNFWTAKLDLTTEVNKSKCVEFVQQTTSKLNKSIKEGHWNIIGIPLQCQIVAEIFLEDCRNYIRSNNFSSEFLNKIEHLNIADVYDMFIKVKKNIYFNEKSHADGNPILLNLLEKQFNRALKEHTRMALKQILYDSEYRIFEDLQTLESVAETELLDVGILQKKNASIRFTHQTFAEYLAALHLCETLLKPDVKNEFLHFLIGDIFLKKRFTTLHLFMNCILQKKTICSGLLKRIGAVTSEINADFKGHISVLVKEGYYYLLKLMLQECDRYENILGNINLIVFLSVSNFPVFRLLIEKGADIFTTHAGYSLLHVILEHSETVLKYLITNGLDINARDRQGYTPLLRSIPNINKMQILIDNKADVRLKNFYGESALHIACVYDVCDALPILIKSGLDINERDRYGCTPLLRACSFKSYHCVKYLLNNGANVTAVDYVFNNMLHYLAMDVLELNYYNLYEALKVDKKYSLEDQDVLIQDILEEVFRKNCIDVNSVCDKGMTALHQATATDNITMTKFLLKTGASMEMKNHKGMTPLSIGLLRQKFNCASLLIDKGASITASDSQGCNLLHYLAKIKVIRNKTLYTEIVTKIIERNVASSINSICRKQVTALHHAVIANNLLMINILLTKNADQNIKDMKGSSPFLTACLLQKYDCANYLIQHGADVSDTDNEGCDALHYLSKIEFVRNDELFAKFVNKLLQINKGKINDVCKMGMTPLHHAVRVENIIMTKLLLAAGADKEISNTEGATPLLIACCQEDIECAKLLIDDKANTKAVDNEGRNILHYLSGVKYVSNLELYTEIARNIVEEFKEKIDMVCKKSMTALHHAVLSSNVIMTELLLAAGADEEIKNNKGATALLLACTRKKLAVLNVYWIEKRILL